MFQREGRLFQGGGEKYVFYEEKASFGTVGTCCRTRLFLLLIFLLSLGRRYVYSNTKLVNNLIITKLAPEISLVINCDKMLKSLFV